MFWLHFHKKMLILLNGTLRSVFWVEVSLSKMKKNKQVNGLRCYSLEFRQFLCLVWLVGFLTSSSTTRLYRGRAPRQSVWQFNVLPHMRQSWETMTSVSAGHIILTSTQPVGSGRPQRESNPGPPHQESRALPTELPPPPPQFLSITKRRT